MFGSKYFIDTNVFLRVVVKDDAKKAADCERLIERIREGVLRAYTSRLVLAEMVWTCLSLYKLKKREVVPLIRGLASIHHLSFKDEYDTLRACALWEEYPVKFIDALIASDQSIAAGEMAIVSYDTDFDKIGVKRVEPSELL